MKPVRHRLPCLLIAMSAAACLPAAGFLLRLDADDLIAEAEANRALFPWLTPGDCDCPVCHVGSGVRVLPSPKTAAGDVV